MDVADVPMLPIDSVASSGDDDDDDDWLQAWLDECDVCGGAADGPGDAHRVHCDCGDVVCSACCQPHGGESYCPTCAEGLRDAEAATGPPW